MTPEEAKKFPKFKPGELHPLLKDIPPRLKDPANYEKIQKALLETIAGHSHSELFQFANCVTCTNKMLERRLLLKRLGFKNPAQYMAWKKVMDTMTKTII